MRIFDALFTFYGPQHWWPGETPFEIAIGAILAQNTNWRNAERAITNLKKNGLLLPEGLHRISIPRLGKLIRSAGFYNIKAKRVKHFVTFLMSNYDGAMGKMRHGRLSSLRKELLGIKGIGPETCDSILLYALEKPVFVIDGYTRRILSRHGLIKNDASYDEIRELFESNLKRSIKCYNEYHALLVKLAKEKCRAKNPLCDGCPLVEVVESRKRQ
jgi:endonuclease-3 related protein